MRRSPHASPALLLLALLLAPWPAACTATTPETATAPAPAAPAEEESVKPGINEGFLAEDLDVDSYVQRFEVESREIAASHRAILAALGVRPGMDVADVGAGTGLFLEGLSRAAGPEGSVRAVDISPRFVEHLRGRAADEGLENVEVVLCSERSAELPESSVDLIFVCDTYHHFEYPRSTLASLYAALRPGGSMVVIDFERIPGVSREWLLDHVRAGKEVFRSEIEEAGFLFVRELEIEGLEENYALLFER